MRKIKGCLKRTHGKIMNEKNEWDQNVKAELVEGSVERVISQEKVVK